MFLPRGSYLRPKNLPRGSYRGRFLPRGSYRNPVFRVVLPTVGIERVKIKYRKSLSKQDLIQFLPRGSYVGRLFCENSSSFQKSMKQVIGLKGFLAIPAQRFVSIPAQKHVCEAFAAQTRQMARAGRWITEAPAPDVE